MRFTQSEDGVPRFTLKIETRLTLHDMAVFLVLKARYDISPYIKMDENVKDFHNRVENELKNWMSGKTTKKLKEIVAEQILLNGEETPHYVVYDEKLEFAVEFLTGYLHRKYPGIMKV